MFGIFKLSKIYTNDINKTVLYFEVPKRWKKEKQESSVKTQYKK